MTVACKSIPGISQITLDHNTSAVMGSVSVCVTVWVTDGASVGVSECVSVGVSECAVEGKVRGGGGVRE